jgi:hypothetical protein
MIALIQPQNKASIQAPQSLPMQLQVEAIVNDQQIHVYSEASMKNL